MTGDRRGAVIVIRDLLRSDFRPPDCLLEHPEDLPACDFDGYRKNPPGFDLAAARQVKGVKLVDPRKSSARAASATRPATAWWSTGTRPTSAPPTPKPWLTGWGSK